MNCTSHRAAFIDLAASGSEPVSEWHAHLRDCPSCRATLERERNLFATIDVSVRASADVEVPVSLLPRVRAHLDAPPTHTFVSPRVRNIALTLAAAAVLLISIDSLRERSQPESVSLPSRHTSPSPPENDALAPSTGLAAAHRSKKLFHPPAALQQQTRLAHSGPEIIVSPDQEILLTRYADQLNQRRNSRDVMTTQSASVELQSLEVDLIQIAQLNVKPLAEQPE